MAKPRVIIADPDFGYVIPLQLKFAEEFFDKVDLEIITDRDYFDKTFSLPQKADVLIVSEDFYDITLQRHTISNIFLMMEQNEEESTAELNVSRLYKYTSIKEIFSEIIGKSGDAFNVEKAAKKEPQIVLFTSASGGAGKTTLALGVSVSLTRNYKRVLYINADRLQTFQHMLENSAPISAADVYAKLSNASENIFPEIKHVIRKEVFSYLPPFKAALMSLGLQYSIFDKIARAAKKSGEYDYIIVDADVTFDEEKAELINLADKVVVVTNQSYAAVSATNTLVSNVNGMGGEKYIFVCNKFQKENSNALIASNVSLKFTVSDYVEYFPYYEQMKPDEFAKESSIQRVAFLMV